jgi:hypothetical protein
MTASCRPRPPLSATWALASAFGLALAGPGTAQEVANVNVPASLSFQVADVGASSTGAPLPTAVSYSAAQLVSGNVLRISVKAESAELTPPSGAGIPVSKVSWTASNAQGGVGSSGTLSDTTWGQVFESGLVPIAGGVDLTWTLAGPGAEIRAGSHQLTLRWKFESVVP